MQGFQHSSPKFNDYDDEHQTSTYLLTRDEDCENLFHSTADFVYICC